MAVVPMPDVPPCTKNRSPARRPPRITTFDLGLTLTPTQFSARFQQAVPPFAAGDVISGHILRVDGAIVTLALIPA
jgi:hypothetical protein